MVVRSIFQVIIISVPLINLYNIAILAVMKNVINFYSNPNSLYHSSHSPPRPLCSLSSTPAPEQPPPPTVTVGINGFTIAGLGPMEVVVEYVCNYTSVITRETVQVRMKPNETADVSLEKVGGYIVQVRPQVLLTREYLWCQYLGLRMPRKAMSLVNTLTVTLRYVAIVY